MTSTRKPMNLRRTFLPFLALSGLASVLAGDLEAQERPATMGVVRGVVVDADSDRPLDGATVSLDDATPGGAVGGSRAWTVTDGAGRYRLGDVPPGRYRLRVSRLGYRDQVLWLELPAAWELDQSVGMAVAPLTVAPVQVRLFRGAGHGLVGMGAGGSPSSRGAAEHSAAGTAWSLDVHRLDPASLPGSGALGEPDVLRALRRLPGVTSRGDFTATVWTRGAPWGLAPVVLDGLPLFDPLHLGGIATGLAADALADIKLLPGVLPASASTGAAAGAVVLGTAPARSDAPTLTALTPLALRVRAEDRWAGERVGLAVAARRSWWDVIAPPSLGSDPQHGAMDYRFADVSARADWVLGSRTRVDLGVFWEEDRLEGSVRDLVAKSRGAWGNRTTWLALRRTAGPVTVRARWGRVTHRGRTRPFPWFSFVTPDGIPVLDWSETALDHTSLRLEATGLWAGDRIGWSVGYESTRQALRQDGLEARERELPGTAGEVALARGVAWAESEAHLGPVRLAGGVAVDRLPDGMEQVSVRPSVRVAWSPRPWLTVEAARGVSRQFAYPLAPAGTTLGPGLAVGHLWVLANADHPSLTSTTRTVSVRVRPLPGVTARLSSFRRRTDGFWMYGVSALSEGRPMPASSDGTGGERSRGTEITLAVDRGPVGFSASYSRVRSAFRGDQVEDWPSPAQRPKALDLALTLDVARGFHAGLDLVVESGWPVVVGPGFQCPEDPGFCVDPPEGTVPPDVHGFSRAPSYASLDLRLAWERTFGSTTWSVDLGLRNLLGRRNAAAYRVGTCAGAELISAVCERPEGLARFEPGLVRPTPSVGLRVRF